MGHSTTHGCFGFYTACDVGCCMLVSHAYFLYVLVVVLLYAADVLVTVCLSVFLSDSVVFRVQSSDKAVEKLPTGAPACRNDRPWMTRGGSPTPRAGGNTRDAHTQNALCF